MINQSCSILIPAHDEVDNLELIIKKCFNWLKEHTMNYSVIVVNDGSTDGSKEILNELLIKEPKLKVITHQTNLGIGAA